MHEKDLPFSDRRELLLQRAADMVELRDEVGSFEPRKLGDFAGRIRMSEDFDEWPQDLQEALGMAEPSAGAARKRAEREGRAPLKKETP